MAPAPAAAPMPEPDSGPDDDQDKEDRATPTEQAMGSIAAALGAIAAREPGATHYHAAPVTVQPAQINLAAGATNVHLPDGLVTLEATVEAPVTVNTPPAQVVVQQAPQVPMRQRVTYTNAGDIDEIIQEPMR